MTETSGLTTRGFEPTDLELVGAWLRAEGLGVPAGASHKVWGRRLQHDPRIVYRGGIRDGVLFGFYRLDLGPDRRGEVTVLVAPGHRRRGLGRWLLEQALHQARVLGLRLLVAEVQERNERALAFFAEAGFEPSRSLVAGFVRLERAVHRSAGQTPLEITP